MTDKHGGALRRRWIHAKTAQKNTQILAREIPQVGVADEAERVAAPLEREVVQVEVRGRGHRRGQQGQDLRIVY